MLTEIAEQQQQNIEQQIRKKSTAVISTLLLNSRQRPRIERWLLIGANCPYGGRSDRQIWMEVFIQLWDAEVNRVQSETSAGSH